MPSSQKGKETQRPEIKRARSEESNIMGNFNLFTHPETFRRMNPKFLSQWLVPHGEYLGTRGLTVPAAGADGSIDYERLVAIFMEPDRAMPRPLTHSASLIHEMANEDAMTALLDGAKERGVLLAVGDDPDPADVALQMWLHDADLLEELHQLHQLDRPRSFILFGCGLDGVPAFREPSDVQLAELEQELGEWFFQQKRGRSVRVWVYHRENEVWFLVRHGLANKRQEILSDKGPDTLMFRPGEYDVLAYNRESGELRVHGCNKKEVDKLRRAFGRHIFGGEEFFPGGEKFTFAPLVLAKTACLACGDVAGIESITLTEVQSFAGGKHWLRVTYQSDDVFAAIARGEFVMPPLEQMVRVSFVIRFSDSAKKRTVKLIGSNKISVVRDGDTVLVERWLTATKFIRTKTHDEESEVLALA